jgi:hypothetical protein
MGASIAARSAEARPTDEGRSAGAPPIDPPVGDPPLAGLGRRAWIVGRVQSPDELPAFAFTALSVHVRPAARAAPFFREQRLDRRDGIDLAPA